MASVATAGTETEMKVEASPRTESAAVSCTHSVTPFTVRPDPTPTPVRPSPSSQGRRAGMAATLRAVARMLMREPRRRAAFRPQRSATVGVSAVPMMKPTK